MNKLLAMAMLVNFCTSLAAQTGVTDKHNLNPASTLMEDMMAGQWKVVKMNTSLTTMINTGFSRN